MSLLAILRDARRDARRELRDRALGRLMCLTEQMSVVLRGLSPTAPVLRKLADALSPMAPVLVP